LAFVMLLPLAACGTANIRDYLPFEHNLLLTYTLEQSNQEEPVMFQIFTEFIRDNRVQRRIQSEDGRTFIEILEVRDNRLMMVNVINHFYEHVDVTSHPATDNLLVLSGPLREGTMWQRNAAIGDSSPRGEITGTNVSVTTPAGTFNAIEVHTIMPREGFASYPWRREYFAPGIGLVKAIASDGIRANAPDAVETLSTTTLIDIHRYGMPMDVTIFYFNEEEESYFSMAVTHTTNNDLATVYMDLLRRASDYIVGHELNADAAINFARLDHIARTLTLDFNAAFMAEIALITDVDYERKIFHAIVDTFAFLYNVPAVHISIDGVPFSGIGIQLATREFVLFGTGDLYE